MSTVKAFTVGSPGKESLALIIPKALHNILHIEKGSSFNVDLNQQKGQLIFTLDK